MDKNERGKLFLVFFSRFWDYHMDPSKKKVQNQNIQTFHSTDFNPADGCVGKKFTGLLRETGLDFAGDQRNKLQKAQGNIGSERLRNGSPVVKIIPSDQE